jgi:phage tail protein X
MTAQQEVKMSEQVKRYDCAFGSDEMFIAETGDYVLATDYDALHTEAEALQRQVTELTNQRDAILLQARCWAGEAKTQQSITKAVGEALGGVPDWGPIAAGVEALRAENEKWRRRAESARGLIRYPCRIWDGEHAESQEYAKGYNMALDHVEKLNTTPAPEVQAKQGERQEAVAWALANSADEIGGFAPIYYTKEDAISWANGRNIFPLYTTPQPGQDIRGLVDTRQSAHVSVPRELEPCDCGSSDSSIGYESPQGYWVECGDCGYKTEKTHGRDLAITAWNRRTLLSGG